MGKDSYQCAICDGVFTKAWSDEEASTELATNFPGTPVDDCDVVCDDCYQMVMNNKNAGRA